MIHTLTDGKEPRNMRLLVRGNPETPGAEVPRRFLAVLGGEDRQFSQGSGRLELAQAIASPLNPLTARVLVNRVWQHHFGRGLVATPSNFGSLGERPSHPELLDWLASRFVRGGWSMKRLHREIVLSATYQQSSRFDARAYEIDPGNILLWRTNRRRLEVEAWRDALLAVSGRLDPTVGGPSVGLDTTGNCRRTCYAVISRHDLAPLLRLFDFPDPNITSGGRLETTVPLQQLFVLNSEFMIQSARSLARRLETSRQPGEEVAARIRRAYVWLYGRTASPREIALGRAFVQDQAEPGESRYFAVRTSTQEGTAAGVRQAPPWRPVSVGAMPRPCWRLTNLCMWIDRRIRGLSGPQASRPDEHERQEPDTAVCLASRHAFPARLVGPHGRRFRHAGPGDVLAPAGDIAGVRERRRQVPRRTRLPDHWPPGRRTFPPGRSGSSSCS